MISNLSLLNKTLIRWVVVLLILPLAILIVSCGDDLPVTNSTYSTSTVTGLVVNLESTSLVDLYSLTVVDESQIEWYFLADGYKGFTQSHLKQHMLLGDPVAVVFHIESGEMLIDNIDDWVEE